MGQVLGYGGGHEGEGQGERPVVPDVWTDSADITAVEAGDNAVFARGEVDVTEFDSEAFTAPVVPEEATIPTTPAVDEDDEFIVSPASMGLRSVEVIVGGVEVNGEQGEPKARAGWLSGLRDAAGSALTKLSTLSSEGSDDNRAQVVEDDDLSDDGDVYEAIVLDVTPATYAEQVGTSTAAVRSEVDQPGIIKQVPGLDIVQDRRSTVRDRHVGVDGSGLGVFDKAPDPTTQDRTIEHPVVPHVPGDPLMGGEQPGLGAQHQVDRRSRQPAVQAEAVETNGGAHVLPFVSKEERRRAANAEIIRAQQERKAAEAAQIQNFQAGEAHRVGQFIEEGIDHRFYVGGVERPELLGLDNFSQMHYYLRAQVAANLELSSGVAWDQRADPTLINTEEAQVSALIQRQLAFACNERDVDLSTELDAERRKFVLDKAGKTTETMTTRALYDVLPSIYQGLGELMAPPTSEAIKAARKANLPEPERLTPAEAMAKHREQAAIDLLVKHAGLNREGPHTEFDILEGGREIIVWDDLIPVKSNADDGNELGDNGSVKYQAQLDPNVQGIAKLRRLFPQDNNVPDGANFMVEGIYKPAGEHGGYMVAALLSQVGVAPMYPNVPTRPQRNGLQEMAPGSALPATINVGGRYLPRTRTVMQIEVRHLTDPAFGWLADAKLNTEREKARGGSRAQLETIHPAGVGEIWATGLWNNVMPTLEHVSQQIAEAEAAAKEAFENHLEALRDHVLLRQQITQPELATAHTEASYAQQLELGGRFAGAIEASSVTSYGPATNSSLAELVAISTPTHDMEELQALQDAEVTLNFS